MKRIWFIVLALSIGLNVGLISVLLVSRTGQPVLRADRGERFDRGERRRGEGRRGTAAAPQRLSELHMRRLEHHIDLTEGQRKEISAILDDYMPRIVNQRQRIDDIRGRLGVQVAIPELNFGGFRTLVDSLNQEQARLDSLVMESMLAEAALLTPEQRRQYAGVMPWGRPSRPPRAGRR